MSVEMIIGRAGSGKTFSCFQQIKNFFRESPTETEIIFLLPAYQTYRAELEFAQISGGAINMRMHSFQRFARQILSEVGGSVIPRISEIGRRILLRKILLDRAKSDELKYYKRAARQRGFAETLAKELQELRTYSIDAENLRKILPKIEDEELANKIHDLALLAEDFHDAIKDKQNDESDLIEKAAEYIKNSAAVRRSEIFIDGFIFFDPQQRKILRELFRYAKNVHITLPMDTELDSRENFLPIGIFNRSFKTYEMIQKLAKEVGVEFKVIRCENFQRFESDEFKFIEQNFFVHKSQIFSKKNKHLKLVEAVNKRVEVEAAARDILRLYREKNFRFRDIGIISRDETYNELCKPIFEMHNIPFFTDGKRAAIHHPLAELIRSSLEVLRGRRAESIFRCLRTGFFNLSTEEIDLLENYVIEFGIRGESILNPKSVWKKHRHKLDEPADGEPNESEVERLNRVNKIRTKISQSYLNFAKSVGKKNTVVEFCKALYNFIDDLNVHEQLVNRSEEEESRGNLSLSKENLKIWDDIITLLDQVAESMSGDFIDLREFEAVINEGLDALEMSIIPPGVDEVTISSFDQNSLQNSDAIYILGFSDANFPKRAEEKFLLSDADRLHMNDLDLEISKGGRETMAAEKFLIYRGLTEMKKYLYISYPLADSEGKAVAASAHVEKLKKMFPALKIETADLDILSSFGNELDYIPENRELSKKIAWELYAPKKIMRGSVSKFEKFNNCPFKYFVDYGLKLAERQVYRVAPIDVGDILHGVMRQFGEDLKSENRRWATVEDDELKQRVTKIVDALTTNLNNKILLSTSTRKRQGERIKKVATSSLKRLIELDRASKFHPEFFEEKFDALSNKALVYNIGGVKMELEGTVDRVDFNESGKYFMIIDYKTGKAYVNLLEIYAGVNLQLLTYLAVTNKLDKIGERLPAGMLYYFLKYPAHNGNDLDQAETKIGKDLQPSGRLLADKNLVCEFDSTSEFIKISFKKDGSFAKKTEDSILWSAETFNLLLSFVEEIFCTAGEKILSGVIKAKPFQSKNQDACKFCDYAALCDFSPKTDKGRTVEVDDNEEILKLISEHKSSLNF